MGVALSISLEEPISAHVRPYTVPMETRWETCEWVNLDSALSLFPGTHTTVLHTPLTSY